MRASAHEKKLTKIIKTPKRIKLALTAKRYERSSAGRFSLEFRDEDLSAFEEFSRYFEQSSVDLEVARFVSSSSILRVTLKSKPSGHIMELMTLMSVLIPVSNR